MEKYSLGENIASYCTKCKSTHDHAVVAMDGETIAKVKCNTCGYTYKFKDPAEEPKNRPPRVKPGGGIKISAASLWENSIAGARGKEYAYSMAGKYRIGDIVIHDRFGKGVVLKLYTHKCGVLFKDEERLMVSAN